MKYPRANYADQTEMALAAIMAVLWPNAEMGWNEWSRYALAGEWI